MTDTQNIAPRPFECLVVGGGPAGLAAAAALAINGLDVAVAAGSPADSSGNAADTRTAALFPPAIALLDRLGAWADLQAHSAPLTAIRIIDDSGGLLRAPEVMFRASDIGEPDLGHNVPNVALTVALAAAAARLGVASIANGHVTGVETGATTAGAILADGRRLHASLIVAADGRDSIVRAAAGIAVRAWSYDQSAVACRFEHSRPHGGVSTELHGTAGPCTTVPLGGNASSLVWMERPAEIARLIALPPPAFLDALERKLRGLLGTLSALGPRRSFPLSGLVATTMGRARVALVGEAGHALPPIGAQGLNLGLVDAAVLADVVAAAHAQGHDMGSARVLAGYHAARAADVRRRAGAVDLLNRSLESGVLPLHLARGAGLHVLAALPALRQRLMREGLYPPDPLPRLMRPA